MAIFHFNQRGVCPASGPSALKKAAYQSGQALTDFETGEVIDYPRKERVVDCGLVLPDGVTDFDRERVWNMAQAAWSGHTALTATRYEFAIPRELSFEEQRQCVLDFCSLFPNKAVDWAIHIDEDGRNPHAHVMVSALGLAPEGFIKEDRPKTTRKYWCRKDGIDRALSPAEFKALKADGWEKLFHWRDPDNEDGEISLTKSEAKARGLTIKADRLSKDAITSVFDAETGENTAGRNREKLKDMRASWERIANAALDRHAAETGEKVAHIDHRSNAERGLDELPTIHEGGAGLIGHAERVQRNKEIKERNERLKVLRAELAREQAELADLEREVERAKRKARTAEGSWQKRPRGGERKRKAAVAKRRRQAMATASARLQVEQRMAAVQTDTEDTTAYYAEQLDAQIEALGQQIHELQHAPTPSTANLNKALKLAEERRALIAERKGIKPAEPTVQPPKPKQGRPHGPKH